MVPCPTATHRIPFQVTLFALVKMALPVGDAVHVIPSTDDAMVFVPEPTTTHRDPVQAMLLPCVGTFGELMAVQVIPSVE